MKKIIVVFLILITLSGCQFWEDLKNLDFKKQFESNLPEQNSTINETNATVANNTLVIETPKIFYNSSLKNIFIPSANSILIIEENISYIIDAPKDNPKIITYLNDFGVNELEFAIATIDKAEHNGGIQFIVTKTPPRTIYDNGVENEYRSTYILRLDRYNTYWNRTQSEYKTVLGDMSIGNFKFFTPYSRGLSTVKEENSIVVFYDNNFLYMSDCYGNCENKIPPVTTEFLILANNGTCPTNSFDFVLSAGAKYVIGDEICESLKSELDIIGINHISINEHGTIQILLEDDKSEFRTER